MSPHLLLTSYLGKWVVSFQFYRWKAWSGKRLSHSTANDKKGNTSQLLTPTSMSHCYLPGIWFCLCLLFCCCFPSPRLTYKQVSKILPGGICAKFIWAPNPLFWFLLPNSLLHLLLYLPDLKKKKKRGGTSLIKRFKSFAALIFRPTWKYIKPENKEQSDKLVDHCSAETC